MNKKELILPIIFIILAIVMIINFFRVQAPTFPNYLSLGLAIVVIIVEGIMLGINIFKKNK